MASMKTTPPTGRFWTRAILAKALAAVVIVAALGGLSACSGEVEFARCLAGGAHCRFN